MKPTMIYNVLMVLIVFASAITLTIYFNNGNWMWLTAMTILLFASYKRN